MTQEIPAALQGDVNRQVLRHLEDKSAHSDIVDALRPALKPLGDVQLFCPNWQAYRYVVASTRDVIFALAHGMNTIGFRLDERMNSRALECGGRPFPECGQEWVAFTLFRNDWPKVDLEFWARQAYVAAREIES